MQQFIFVPLATYTSQMVFVKTFKYLWSNQKNLQNFWRKSNQVQLLPTETGKASGWKSLLTDTQSNVKLWTLSNSDTFPLQFRENDRS